MKNALFFSVIQIIRNDIITRSAKLMVIYIYILATLVPNWSIFNITKIDLDKIVVEWHHHPPVTYPLDLFAYAVVCTPTDGKLGPTLTTVRGNINRTEVLRLRPGTNYSVEIVALIKNNQTEEITLEKSQTEGLETDEGGKTILILSV